MAKISPTHRFPWNEGQVASEEAEDKIDYQKSLIKSLQGMYSDISNAININADAYIPLSLFDADTFLYAAVDNTPVATSPANVLVALSGHAGAAFNWGGQALTGVASVTLSNAGWVGIGAALERLEFYTAGYASFMGCNVGIGTITPGNLLDIEGSHAGVALSVDNTNAAGYGLRVDTSGNTSAGEFIADFRSGGVSKFKVTTDGNVGIGTPTPNDSVHALSAASSNPIVTLENTNADTHGATLQFRKVSASQADDDNIGVITARGKDSVGTDTSFTYMEMFSSDITDGDEAGKIAFRVRVDNVYKNLLDLNGFNGVVGQGEVIINEDAADIDFRVEAVGQANALFVRGSDGYIGGNTAAPGTKLELNNTGAANASAAAISMNASDSETWRLGPEMGGVTGTWGLRKTTAIDGAAKNIFTVLAASGNLGINVSIPLGKCHIDQSGSSAVMPTLILDQADISEGFINFIGSNRGIITGATNSLESIRVERNGVVYRLALYADA